MNTSPTRPYRIWRRDCGRAPAATTDLLAVEEPLEIRVNTRPVVVTMRTPGHDEELATGFLATEGLLHRREDVQRFAPSPRNTTGNVLEVFLAPDVRLDYAQLTRHVYASSSCGLCGRATIEAVQRRFPRLRPGFRLRPAVLRQLPERLRQAQAAFALTGGLHAAGLFDARGRLLVLREDVGRHNAVDKVLGHALLAGLWPLSRHVLLVSGRASFEILQKSLAARIPIVAAVSAPSSLAVDFARRSGQCLVGFLRDQRMNIYAHPRRLQADQPTTRQPH
ncbi:MAG: formate dehydrogenase accessory sulfurtransferase FdhD [Verrucomicrobiota bacterium]|jgi:FdhD protein